jgi:hypothetical protein
MDLTIENHNLCPIITLRSTKDMTIEKRFHQRMEIDADVDIHIMHRDRHIMAKAENLTPYGILLSTEKLSVPTGMLLELSIEIDGNLRTVPGLVIWAEQQKIGVMFPEIQPGLFTAAEELGREEFPKKKRSSKKRVASPGISPKHMLFQPEPHTQA